MKKKITVIGLIALLTLLLTGGIILVLGPTAFGITFKDGKLVSVEKVKPVDTKMFSAYTDVEEFQNVPAMETQGKILKAEDYGKNNYLINVNGSTVEEYKAYLKVLESAGFKKHSENGEDAMEGYAMTASYKKDNLTLTVSHAVKSDRTYISATYDLALSDHLIYSDEFVKNNIAGKQTKVHMLQMKESQGCSFIYELKNGHFVVHDGGLQAEAAYFIEYINSLTPEGEVPVIEAWFISHCHNDHYGVLTEITQNQAWLNQIRVNGFYYVEPSAALFSKLTTQSDPNGNMIITRAYKMFKTEDGGTPEFYRPQFGQRYYFCDIVIDVSMTLEQLPIEAFRGTDFNDTSLWLMHKIEGQRMLFAGDSGMQGCYAAIEMFDSEYFKMDIFVPFHHGINVYDHFTEYCTYDTVLYPSWRAMSIWETRDDLKAEDENENLKSRAKEVYHFGEGTIILTFPYKIGTAEQLEKFSTVYKPL